MSAPSRRAIWPGARAPITEYLRSSPPHLLDCPWDPGRTDMAIILEIQRPSVHRQRGFLDSLGQSGMGVADASDVLARGAELHGRDPFADQLGDHRADHVHSQDAV